MVNGKARNFVGNIDPNDLLSKVFKNYPGVTELYVEELGITELKNGSFENAKFLMKLYLSKNQITKFQANAFSGATNLREIRAHTNNLNFISFQAFVGLDNLEGVFLGNNNFTVIFDGTFHNPKLSKIDFFGGKLKSIGKDAFKNQTLRFFNLEKNPCGGEMLHNFDTYYMNGLHCPYSGIEELVTLDEEHKLLIQNLKNKIEELETEATREKVVNEDLTGELKDSIADLQMNITILENDINADKKKMIEEHKMEMADKDELIHITIGFFGIIIVIVLMIIFILLKD